MSAHYRKDVHHFSAGKRSSDASFELLQKDAEVAVFDRRLR